MTGKVKWFDNKKGFGYLVCDEVDKDVFIYYKNINKPGYKTLHEGEELSFTLTENSKGYEAKEVTPI